MPQGGFSYIELTSLNDELWGPGSKDFESIMLQTFSLCLRGDTPAPGSLSSNSG